MSDLEKELQEFLKEPLSTDESFNITSGSELNKKPDPPTGQKFWWMKDTGKENIEDERILSHKVDKIRSEVNEDFNTQKRAIYVIDSKMEKMHKNDGCFENKNGSYVAPSPDVSSSMMDFLEKEKICKDLSEASLLKGTFDMEDDLTDDGISSIIEQIGQLATSSGISQEDADVEKSVEEIMEEAEKIVQISTPVFQNIFGSVDGMDKSVSVSSLSLGKKVSSKGSQKEDRIRSRVHHNGRMDNNNLDTVLIKQSNGNTVSSNVKWMETSIRKEDKTMNFGDSSVPCLLENGNEVRAQQDGARRIPDECKVTEHLVSLAKGDTTEDQEKQCDTEKDSFGKALGVTENTTDVIIAQEVNSPDEGRNVSDVLHHLVNEEIRNEIALAIRETNYDNCDDGHVSDKGMSSKTGVTIASLDKDVTINELLVKSKDAPMNNPYITARERPKEISAFGSSLSRSSLQQEAFLDDQKHCLELQAQLVCEEQKHKKQLDAIMQKYEEEILQLRRQIHILSVKVDGYEKCEEKDTDHKLIDSSHSYRISLLEKELLEQEHLIGGYQQENRKLYQEIKQLKEMLKTSVVKRKQNEEETVAVTLTVEKASLLEQIKGKDEAILQLQKEVNSLKNAIEGYTNTISDQQKTMTTLKTTIAKCNAPSYSKEINTLPLSKIPRNLTSEIEKYKKQCAENVKEISRLRKNLDTLQKELEVRNSELIEVQSVKSRNEDQIKSLKATVEDLQSALKKEESLTKKYIQQQEEDQKNVHCLKKELNEMKQILKSNHPDSISSLILAANSETASSKAAAQIEFLEARVQQLEKELESKEQTTQRNMEDMQAYIQNMKVKYEEQIASLQVQVPTSKQELKGAVRKNQTPSSKGTNETSDDSRNRGPFQRCNAPISSSHGDSYLLASIKGFKQEISARDKEIRKLNKDMHDLRKTNEALQKEHKQYIQRESGFRHQGIAKGILDRKKIHTNQDNKPYNPTVFESPVEHQETIEKLEKENQHLKRELIQLEDEFRNLRTKWLEDISALQCRHDEEMDRILSQQVPSGSNPHVAELQGQLCTQQVVISHLKEQLKEMSEYREEILVLKAERDHLDKCVLELTKKVNTLRSLQTPEALHFEALQEKIEILEHRHQHREQRLQAILRDLLRRRSQQTLEESNDASATTLRERLIDKNRQLCVYQNEMDHILDSLRELQKQSKMTG